MAWFSKQCLISRYANVALLLSVTTTVRLFCATACFPMQCYLCDKLGKTCKSNTTPAHKSCSKRANLTTANGPANVCKANRTLEVMASVFATSWEAVDDRRILLVKVGARLAKTVLRSIRFRDANNERDGIEYTMEQVGKNDTT